MMEIRRAAARGQVELGWLHSRHTFSFGHYYDPRFLGFGPLRVINEDRVEPGTGFGEHGHRAMEIVSYVVSGTLAHHDSTGTDGVIHPGEVQVMSAGTGIRHSELNGGDGEPVHFLQIWLDPLRRDTRPGYDQKHFGHTEGLTLLVSPDARDGSLPILQDADLWRAILPTGERARVELRPPVDTAGAPSTPRRAWVQVVKGTLDVNGARLYAGDGLAVTDTAALDLVAADVPPGGAAEALVFDLP